MTKKAPSKPKKKSLLKLAKGESRTTGHPYMRSEYLEDFKKLLKQGYSHKQAQAAIIQQMKDDTELEIREFRNVF